MATLGKPVLGRQIIWMFLKSLETNASQVFITSYENIMEMPWYGDAMHQIVEFYYEWVRCRKNMAKNIDEETLRDVLHKKMNTSTVFNDDLAHYQRAKDKSTTTAKDPDYTLDYLERCLYLSLIHI